MDITNVSKAVNIQKILRGLNTPTKIQDYLDSLKFNFEEKGETYNSPIEVMKNKQAHCFEGACLALAAMNTAHKKCYLLDLKVKDLKKDADHTLAIYKANGRWGAISKTNHAVLRWRDPIYTSVRELAVSYFHEYFLNTTGEKTLGSYSAPFDVVKKFGTDWISSTEELDEIALALDKSRHFSFYKAGGGVKLRKAGVVERRSGAMVEWN